MAQELPWFRFYSETPRNPKIRKAAQLAGVSFLEALGFWSVILSLAGESPERGKLLVTFRERFSNGDIAHECNADETLVEKLIESFLRFEMLERDEAGVLSIKNWNKYQYTSDNSTERVRRFREKRSSNVSETAQSQSQNQSQSQIKEEEAAAAFSIFDRPEIAVVREITGIVPDIGNEEKVVNNVRAVRRRMGNPPREQLVDELRKFWDTWRSSRTRDGRLYNPANWDWTERAAVGYIPGQATAKPKRVLVGPRGEVVEVEE